jgi:hypothetical protein
LKDEPVPRLNMLCLKDLQLVAKHVIAQYVSKDQGFIGNILVCSRSCSGRHFQVSSSCNYSLVMSKCPVRKCVRSGFSCKIELSGSL